MDITLRDYLKSADNTLDYLEKYFSILTSKQIEEKITELQSNIKTIQTVAYQLANVSNIATRALHKRNKNTTLKPIDPYPTDKDLGILKSLNPVESKELVKGISVPVKTVEFTTDIPESSLYYVNETKQYAVNIAGIIIRGDLGNIVEYQCENSAHCEYGIDCNSFKTKKQCPYYHQPEDYIKQKLPVPERTKNFTAGSWLYSKTKTPRTYFTRHIGSRDRLIFDLNTIRTVQYREEIANREGQLIHDLLIYLVLNSRGLLDKYKPWKKIPIKK